MRKTRATTSICLLVILIAITAVTGCGRKGGLYLPENDKPQTEKPAPDTASEPADAER